MDNEILPADNVVNVPVEGKKKNKKRSYIKMSPTDINTAKRRQQALRRKKDTDMTIKTQLVREIIDRSSTDYHLNPQTRFQRAKSLESQRTALKNVNAMHAKKTKSQNSVKLVLSTFQRQKGRLDANLFDNVDRQNALRSPLRRRRALNQYIYDHDSLPAMSTQTPHSKMIMKGYNNKGLNSHLDVKEEVSNEINVLQAEMESLQRGEANLRDLRNFQWIKTDRHALNPGSTQILVNHIQVTSLATLTDIGPKVIQKWGAELYNKQNKYEEGDADYKKFMSPTWLNTFFFDHKDKLTFKRPLVIDEARRRASMEPVVNQWYVTRSQVHIEAKGKKDGLFIVNMDEQGMDTKAAVDNRGSTKGVSSIDVLAAQDKLKPSSNHLSSMNILALGPTGSNKMCIPAVVSARNVSEEDHIFWKSLWDKHLGDNKPTHKLFLQHTAKGSVTQDVMLDIVKHAVAEVKRLHGENILEKFALVLEMDAPSVHMGVDWVLWCRDNGISVLFKPHNSTHWSQEADTGAINGQIANVYYDKRSDLCGSGAPSFQVQLLALYYATIAITSKAIERI